MDPLIRGPIIGSLLIAAALAIFGVFAFVRREGLVGECMAHSSYPGIIVAALSAGVFSLGEGTFSFILLVLAFVFGWLSLRSVSFLRKRGLSADSALCFVLSAFFSVGMLASSLCQHLFPFWQRLTTAYLFGQIALMDDTHLVLGSSLLVVALFYILLFFKEAQSSAFDATFSKASGLNTALSSAIYQVTLGAAIVLAIKSVGVILLSGLLIAPAIAARQCTRRLIHMLWLAPLFATVATLSGLLVSLEVAWLAPGPIVMLALAAFCLGLHLVAPDEGLCARLVRRLFFRARCLDENLLKMLWRLEGKEQAGIDSQALKALHLGPRWLIAWKIAALRRRGDLVIDGRWVALSEQGRKKSRRIVRLHRLWEAYLSTALDVSLARVHASAEQIEHILTPELEKQLEMLVDVTNDPHAQAIPEKELL